MSNANDAFNPDEGLIWYHTELPHELIQRLYALGFSGDFSVLGVTSHEALTMDIPTLQRLINEKTGVVEAFKAQKEQETQENNKKFFDETMNRSRILF
jgi:hypothetical protein